MTQLDAALQLERYGAGAKVRCKGGPYLYLTRPCGWRGTRYLTALDLAYVNPVSPVAVLLLTRKPCPRCSWSVELDPEAH